MSVTTATTVVALMAAVMMVAEMTVAVVTANATAAVAAMALAMAAVRRQKPWQQQQWQWGEIQQSIEKGTTETAMVMETAMMTDNNNNNINANANANDSASTAGIRTTRPGCASRWWRWRRCQWWGGSATATVNYRSNMGHRLAV
jgi:hypothetical protein